MFCVAFPPIRPLIFRQPQRPSLRKRKIRQMVSHDFIVQSQRLITLAPVVSNARMPLHHQRIDAELAQSGGNGEAGLSSADDDHFRISVGECTPRLALFTPTDAGFVHGKFLAAWTPLRNPLLVALERLQSGEQQPEGSAASKSRIEIAIALEDVLPGPPLKTRRSTRRGDTKVTRLRVFQGSRKRGLNAFTAGECAVFPGKRQEVFPVTVTRKLRSESF